MLCQETVGAADVWDILRADQRVEAGCVCADADHCPPQTISKLIRTALDQTERVFELVFRPAVIQHAARYIREEIRATLQIGGDMRGEDYAVSAIRNIIGQDVHELVAGQYVQTAGRLVENQQFRIVLNATASMSFICMPRDRSLIFLFRPSPNRLRYASNRLWSHSGYIGLLVRSTASTVMYSMK